MCVFVMVLRLYLANPGWGARCGCVCLGSGYGYAPPLLAGVFGVCVCLFAHPACTPPLLARVCSVAVCAWSRVSGAPCHSLAGVLECVCVCVRALLVPRHSWLGCALGVCVCGLAFWAVPRHSWLRCWGVCVFVYALRLYPATPGWGLRCGCVCLGSGFGCALPLLADVVGCVCVRVRAPHVPRQSWLGCAVCVCVLVLGLWLRPATPGWGFGLFVCLCARSACTLPLLFGVCGVGVCAWARVSAAPRHSLVGCWDVCVFVCTLCLYPATPGWGVRCGCVCLGSGLGCAPPLLAGVLGCVCVCDRAPLVPRQFRLGCAVWVSVLGLGFWLRPATPGWVFVMCVCLCAHSACTLPLLAGVCSVVVCVWAGVSAAPRHSLLG